MVSRGRKSPSRGGRGEDEGDGAGRKAREERERGGEEAHLEGTKENPGMPFYPLIYILPRVQTLCMNICSFRHLPFYINTSSSVSICMCVYVSACIGVYVCLRLYLHMRVCMQTCTLLPEIYGLHKNGYIGANAVSHKIYLSQRADFYTRFYTRSPSTHILG